MSCHLILSHKMVSRSLVTESIINQDGESYIFRKCVDIHRMNLLILETFLEIRGSVRYSRDIDWDAF